MIKDDRAGEASGSGSQTRSKDRGAKRHDDRRERDTNLSSNKPMSSSSPSTSTSKHLKTDSKAASVGNKKKLSFGYSSDEDEDGE